MTNSFLLLGEAIVYFGLMVTLFRLRGRIGVGVFMCALGVMHFLETYLASVFYVALPFGLLSPGSTVLFSGKLVMLLLLYMKEDAATVRQPIYGLMFGNVLIIGLVLVLRLHEVAPMPDGRLPDIAFINQMGWLMVWGTTLLFVDAILIILLYEKLGRLRQMKSQPLLRIATAVCCILTLDQVGFFTALHLLSGAPFNVLLGGWVAKMCAGLVYSGMLMAYLRWFEAERSAEPRGIADVFQTLTYRERYEALVEHAGRDGLTGLLHRGRFESDGELTVANSIRTGKPLSLLVIDVDHFKSINDRFGHAEGDRVLKAIASLLTGLVGTQDRVFRIGGEEFAILCSHPQPLARLLGENIRLAIKGVRAVEGLEISISGGVAAAGGATTTLADLFEVADRRLYAAKAGGRDRIVSEGGERSDVTGYRSISGTV